jgi:hypothetical protein
VRDTVIIVVTGKGIRPCALAQGKWSADGVCKSGENWVSFEWVPEEGKCAVTALGLNSVRRIYVEDEGPAFCRKLKE